MRPDKQQLKKFSAYYKSDTAFASSARLKQSMWRESNGYKKPDGKLGNYIDRDYAKAFRSNFLTNKIKTLVQYELYSAHYKGKLISEPRIWENLLSSQPLAFNLFGEMHFDLSLATRFFKKLYPGVVNEVNQILFEHSPGRGNKGYTGDHSAFDVFIEFLNKEKRRGFIGIEVKYAEDMKDSEKNCKRIFDDHKADYIKLTNKYKIFIDGAIDNLKHAPLQQVWRDHLLAIATLQDYDMGFFVFLYPKENDECQKVVTDYKKTLNSDCSICSFVPALLEDYISVISKSTKAGWVDELKARYLVSD